MVRISATLLLTLIPCLAFAQGTPRLFSNSDLRQYSVPSCRNLGCERQVIDPERTLSRYGYSNGASEWVSRVRSNPLYASRQDENETCSGAVRGLFKFVCNDRTNCEIEDEYKRACVDGRPDQRTAEQCVNVVDTYVDKCFGEGCPWSPISGGVGGFLIGDDAEPFCSASAFAPASAENDRNSGRAATVEHCMPKVNSRTRIIRPPRESSELRTLGMQNERYGRNIRAFEINVSFERPVQARRPSMFARTVFQGFNSLIHYRNAVRPAAASPRSKLTCDSSPLCTIVDVHDGKLLHTCQSTKGGSGGALVQFIGGAWVLVGLNNGSPSQGLVTENEGLGLLE
jgi:hypothetical protein